MNYAIRSIHAGAVSGPTLILLQIWSYNYCWLCHQAVVQATEGFLLFLSLYA